jgi:FMN phosphatase YigB (HAD superfamily)
VAGRHAEKETPFREFRYLTFDCYGTLIDRKTGIEFALGRAFEGATARGRDLMAAYLAVDKKEEGSCMLSPTKHL